MVKKIPGIVLILLFLFASVSVEAADAARAPCPDLPMLMWELEDLIRSYVEVKRAEDYTEETWAALIIAVEASFVYFSLSYWEKCCNLVNNAINNIVFALSRLERRPTPTPSPTPLPSPNGSIAEFGQIMQLILLIFNNELVVFGFTISFWQVFLWTSIASIFLWFIWRLFDG